MRITRLRLTGFKSFVEPAELLIEPGLTGVVGPNGCGKSNLLEAIRWAMGEASAKSLRGGGMEDVIFAGTARRPPRDFAEVTLAIADADGEHDVVRRVERGAGSAYRIDGRDVRARDVALLFADAATGAHSPALVSQGRIAAVIAAKPAERRAMLEEAAGIAGLHVRRREAELKLRATEANLIRLDELLAAQEARAATLRRQARSAERYRALSDEIRLADARSLFARWRQAAAEAEAAAAEAARAEALVATAAEAQRAMAAHGVAAVAAAGEARAAADRAREEADARRRTLDALRLEQADVARRLEALERQALALEQDRAREDRLAIDAAAALSTLDGEDKALGQAIAAAERARPGAEAGLAEAGRAVAQAEVAVAQAQARAAAEAAEVRVAEGQCGAARQRSARAEDEAARLARERDGVGAEAPLAEGLASAEGARREAEQALADAAGALIEAEQTRDDAAQARTAAEAAAGVTQAALARIESEARALEAGLARAGGTGVVATLTVAPGYERALAAALGDDLDAPAGGELGWRGVAIGADDPALPPGTTPLGAQVGGAPALARRLAQVAVVEADAGQPLAVGQRLVTRDGRLRRWDGFVARDGGAATAERLERANRLERLRAELPETRAAAEGARADLANATAAFAKARTAIDVGRARHDAAERTLREARRGEDAAAAALERRAAAAAALAERAERIERELEEARTGLAAAERAVASLPDGAEARAAATTALVAADAARARLAERRVQIAAAAEASARDRRRQQDARAEMRAWRARAGDAAQRIGEMDARTAAVARDREALAERPAALEVEIAAAATMRDAAEVALAVARAQEDEAVAALRVTEARAAEAGEALAAAREARAGGAARAEHLASRRAELGALAGERFQCPAAELPARAGFAADTLGAAEAEGARHERLLAERERLGPVNLVAESELAELDAERTAAAAECAELGEAVNRLRGSIGGLNREGRQRLAAAFEAVDGHFRRLFTTLFAGGEAHLALIDSDDPLEAGLEIMAQPPGKKLGSLTLLSGGEQALTAVALIFALFLTNPAPICVLDEVDAPLDDANIERFCDLLHAMTRETDTRYLIVTHNAVTMSRMHRLFGVTMIEQGVSRLVSVDLGGAERLLAAE